MSQKYQRKPSINKIYVGLNSPDNSPENTHKLEDDVETSYISHNKRTFRPKRIIKKKKL